MFFIVGYKLKFIGFVKIQGSRIWAIDAGGSGRENSKDR